MAGQMSWRFRFSRNKSSVAETYGKYIILRQQIRNPDTAMHGPTSTEGSTSKGPDPSPHTQQNIWRKNLSNSIGHICRHSRAPGFFIFHYGISCATRDGGRKQKRRYRVRAIMLGTRALYPAEHCPDRKPPTRTMGMPRHTRRPRNIKAKQLEARQDRPAVSGKLPKLKDGRCRRISSGPMLLSLAGSLLGLNGRLLTHGGQNDDVCMERLD